MSSDTFTFNNKLPCEEISPEKLKRKQLKKLNQRKEEDPKD